MCGERTQSVASIGCDPMRTGVGEEHHSDVIIGRCLEVEDILVESQIDPGSAFIRAEEGPPLRIQSHHVRSLPEIFVLQQLVLEGTLQRRNVRLFLFFVFCFLFFVFSVFVLLQF